MYILGLESSCDESAAAVLEIKQHKLKILSNIIASQINIHARYGGVIPEIAAREHVLNILPSIEQALQEANLSPQKLHAIAVTQGPGLVSSLLAAIESSKALSAVWQIPIIPVNHIIGHIYAAFIDLKQSPKFPIISLIVSGGHTNLILMKEHYNFKIIGETRDDAAGEAYDKTAKMLGLSYPGGPIIAQYAQKFRDSHKKCDIELPRPMIHSKDFDFSFSGLKTALLYKLQKDKNWKKRIPEYCFAVESAIIETLTHKSLKAIAKYQPKSFVLAGGVAANKTLRTTLSTEISTKFPKTKLFLPNLAYTTDNAAMIASAAYFKYYKQKDKSFLPYHKLKADPNLSI